MAAGAALAVAAGLAAASPAHLDVRAVPTYESAGLYWASPGAPSGCSVRFRKKGDADWRAGLDLWFDARNNECRGSLVYLASGTEYEAQLGPSGGAFTQSIAFRTWPARLPVAKTIRVPAGARMLEIREGGSPAGYVVYDGAGAVIDVGGAQPFNVAIEASYVIVRGLTLRGAARDAIRIEGNVSDVVIEDNDISGWGRPRDGGRGQDLDSGIHAVCYSCPMLERVTIQRNRIHDPRYGANSWSEGHPQGPQAITIGFCGGNHVIRDNVMYSRNGNKFNDVVGGEDNYTKTGFPNEDSDINGNLVSDAWDDGIEAEGGNRNVRIWNNRIDNTAIGIATTVTSVGPVYLFRNVYNRSRFFEKKPPDEDERQVFFKAGSDPALGDGRRYVFHNTMLQQADSALRFPLGAAVGIAGTRPDQPLNNTWSINNIYHLWKAGPASQDVGINNVFANDLLLEGAGASYAAARDRGRRIPNFNDDFAGAAPDIGAQEAGAAPKR